MDNDTQQAAAAKWPQLRVGGVTFSGLAVEVAMGISGSAQVRADVDDIRSGRKTRADLLSEYADLNTEDASPEAWAEYVRTIVAAAGEESEP